MKLLAVLACLVVSVSDAAYDETLAFRLVNYAGAAYCAGQKSVDEWDCFACKKVPGFQQVISLHEKGTDGRGIVGYDTELKARIVSFMGTNTNINTWIDDLRSAVLVDYPLGSCKGCKVGDGFYATYNGLRDQVWDAVHKLPEGPLYITGHSLGAALATLCTADLAERGLKAEKVITVGQPRVGESNFAKYYAGLGIPHYRVTHHRDPIPHLPYESMGFSHITQEVYYEDAKKAGPTHICSPTDGEDKTCADQYDGNVIYIPDHWEYLKFSFLEGVVSCTLAAQGTITV